jgi:hypothetical protein
MTDSELLATGELCSALLISADFATVVAQYEQSIAADIIATKQDDRQKREDLYSSLWGTRGLLEFMQLQASAAATIKSPKNPDEDGSVTDYHVEPLYDDEGFPVNGEDYGH